MKKFFYCFLMCFFFLKAAAQQPKTAAWLGGQLQLKLSDKWAWHSDAGFRTVSTAFTSHQLLYRTGIRYFINKNFGVTAGGALFFTRSSFDKGNHEFGRELRLWQEVFHQTNIHKLIWQNRFTAEQRFFDDTQKKPAYAAYRVRLKTTFTKPVNEKWAVQVSDEYMRQLTNNIFAFDQNRLMAYGLYNSNANTVWRAGYTCLMLPYNQTRYVLNINFQKTITLKHKL